MCHIQLPIALRLLSVYIYSRFPHGYAVFLYPTEHSNARISLLFASAVMSSIWFEWAMIHFTRIGSHSYSAESIYHEKQVNITGISKKSCQKVVKPLVSPVNRVVKSCHWSRFAEPDHYCWTRWSYRFTPEHFLFIGFLRTHKPLYPDWSSLSILKMPVVLQ